MRDFVQLGENTIRLLLIDLRTKHKTLAAPFVQNTILFAILTFGGSDASCIGEEI